jgi:hypothetical protein
MSNTNETPQEELTRKQLEQLKKKNKADNCASTLGCVSCGPIVLLFVLFALIFILA